MVNPKIISISGCIGFGMSLLTGLISGVTIGFVVLRALIFAVVLAVLSVLISFVYEKFLSESSKSNVAVESEPAENKVATGGVVNIVVDDSSLSDDGQGPKFSVSANAKNTVGNFDDVKKVEPVEAPAAQTPEVEKTVSPQDGNESKGTSDSFKPAGLSTITSGSAESPAVVSDTSAAQNNSQTGGASTASSASPEEALDVLPEIGGFELDGKNNAGSGVIGDSDFASSGSSASSDTSGGKDTNTMAMAIRTLLAKDND